MSRCEPVYKYRLPQYSVWRLVSGGVLMIITADVKPVIAAIVYR